jgi:DNA primase
MTDLEDIKARIDLVDFVGRYLPLKKAGTNYRGLCPFHVEKSPSFMVSPDKQIWHCFGCGRGGDVFKFVMEKEGMSFPEALQMLADQAGVTLSRQATGGLDKRKSLLAINELAAKYYEKVLEDSTEGRIAQDYLIGRGITPATMAEFRIGCAPTSGKALVDFLKKREVGDEDIEKAGLGVLKGKYVYDKFTHRVMFPICDSLGRVVAFTGRVLDPAGIPKYLNSPETTIFKKGEVLFGLHLAKAHIQQEGYVVVVEGQMDAISSYQAGVKNVVATSGTAVTEPQLNLLRRYTTQLVLALDGDAAGVSATKRVFELANRLEMEIKVVLLGEAKDPDVLIKQGGEAWQKAIEAAVPMMEFYFSSAIDRYDLKSLDGRKGLTREMLSIITEVLDPVEKDFYIKKLSALVSVDARALYDAISRPKPRTPLGRSAVPSRGEEAKGDQLAPTWLEERIVALAAWKPELIEILLKKADGLKWASGLANTIYEKIRACYTSPDSFHLENVLAQLPDADKTSLLELMLVVEESYQDIPSGDLEKEVELYLEVLQKRSGTAQRQKLVLEISEAERNQDSQKLAELLDQLNQLN